MKWAEKKFRTRAQEIAYANSWIGRYERNLKKNGFLYFGLPFCAMIVLGSYWLADFTRIRYEKYDNKVKTLNEEEALDIGKNRRKVDIKEEFYRLQQIGSNDDWDMVRVPRLKGESENVWDK